MNQPKKSAQELIKRTLIIVGIVSTFLLLCLLFYFAVDLLLLFFAAVLLAVFFRGLGEGLSRFTNFPETISILLAALIVFIVFGIGVWQLAPDVAEQIINLRGFLPKSFETLNEKLSQYNWGRLILEQVPNLSDIVNTFTSKSFLTRIGGFFSSTVAIVINAVVVILLSIYLAIEPRTYINGFIKLIPISRRERTTEVIDKIGKTLRWWMLGKFLSMLIIGVATTIGLWVIGVPLALTLGLIAALLTFIPNFGPLIAVAPAFLIALVESPVKSVYVLALYFGIQMVESYLITPLIERETVSLPPVLTILFQVFMGLLVGGLGLVLASPLLAIVLVLVQMLYIEDVLGDREMKENQEVNLVDKIEEKIETVKDTVTTND